MAAATRVNGRTANGTAWASKLGDAGYIVENGRRDSRVVMASDNQIRQQPNMKERGLTAYRTVTVRKRTLMMVSVIYKITFKYFKS